MLLQHWLAVKRNVLRASAYIIFGVHISGQESSFMATPTVTSRPTPEHIFNTLCAFQQTAALKAGIDLDIFTAIADGANTYVLIAANSCAAGRPERHSSLER